MEVKKLSRIDKLKKRLTVEKERIHFQFYCVYILFMIIAFVMTVVNIVTKEYLMAGVTFSFLILNLISLILILIKNKITDYISRILFCIGIISMFTFFVISGKPEGFSAIWCALLPVSGMILFRKKNGTILSAIMFVILVVLFWTPISENLTAYSLTFKTRFPILYLAFYAVGLFFETIRQITHEELVKTKDMYRALSFTDRLTGLGNETAYFKMISQQEKKIEKKNAKFAIAVLDVNCVKKTNDKYGHRFGCNLIVTAGKMLPQVFKTSQIFHIGGDEFVVLIEGKDFENIDKTVTDAKNTLSYKKIEFLNKKLILSVAIGVCKYQVGKAYKDIFQTADERMYKNKQDLKNKYKII